MNLFQNNDIGAIMSPCKEYRYLLWRKWDESKPMLMFIGLNPSTANELHDDPTVRRLKKFAADWGYGGIYLMNLFAVVSPKPEVLLTSEDPVKDNDSYLSEYSNKCKSILFGWGAFKQAKSRAGQISKLFPSALCLGINADGSPKHPLYIRADTQPVLFSSLVT